MKIIRHIFTGVFIFLVLGAGFLFFSPQLPFGPEAEVKIVKSGSMEPTIMTGAAVVIVAEDSYQVGDVVTFRSEGMNIPTTHRIIASEEVDGKTVFVTKGDANEEADTAPLLASSIIGKVLIDIPYIGFIFDFARQPLGFGLLIGIPALIIIVDEVEKIYRELRRRPARARVIPCEDLSDDNVVLRFSRPLPRTARVVDMCRKTMSNAVSIRETAATELGARNTSTYPSFSFPQGAFGVLASFVIASTLVVGGTVAFGSDLESAVGNSIIADAADFSVVPNTTSITFIDGQVDVSGEVSTLLSLSPESATLAYNVSSDVVSGNPAFCAGLTASIVSPAAYSGILSDLLLEDVVFAENELVMTLGLTPGTPYVDGDTCVVSLDFIGWNDDFDSRFGHYDEEQIILTITALNLPVVAPRMMEGGSADLVAPAALPEPLQGSVIEEPIEETSTEEVVPEVTPEPEPTPEPEVITPIVEPEPEPTPEPEPEPTPEPEPAPEVPAE